MSSQGQSLLDTITIIIIIIIIIILVSLLIILLSLLSSSDRLRCADLMDPATVCPARVPGLLGMITTTTTTMMMMMMIMMILALLSFIIGVCDDHGRMCPFPPRRRPRWCTPLCCSAWSVFDFATFGGSAQFTRNRAAKAWADVSN